MGALICDACYRSARRMLEDAADIVGNLRAKAEPLRSGWNFDRFVSSHSADPSDEVAHQIDAANDMVVLLRAYALLVQFGPGHPWGVAQLEAGISVEDAFEDAEGCATVILMHFDRLASTPYIDRLVSVLVEREIPDEPDLWTFARSLAKWPLDDRDDWIRVPCPKKEGGCNHKTLRRRPSRGELRPARYYCTREECGWERVDTDDSGLWKTLFEPDDVKASSIPLGDDERTSPHDPRWLTLAAAGRLAGKTTATVKSWADRELVRRELGRYWRDDVVSVRDEKDGAAVDAAA